MTTSLLPTVTFSQAQVTIEEIIAIANRRSMVNLSDQDDFIKQIDQAAALLEKILLEDGTIYGVTTGYGDSCDITVQADLIAELSARLYTYHGCGLGADFDVEQTRAIVAARLTSLCKGCSGVRMILLRNIVSLLQADIMPVIPSEGSVGASGDLTPLSYLAAVLCGEREVWRDGEAVPALPQLNEAGIFPLILRPKEGLAIMNGTAAMTGLACLAYGRAEYACRLATRITSFSALVLNSNYQHFDKTLFSMKPHRGMQEIAAWIRQDLGTEQAVHIRNSDRLQDRYSIRCAPHVIGVLADALPWMKHNIEDELNSVNDNPVIDVAGGRILHGGHFYGGHIAFAMDSMKNAVANLADLMDRQMALMVDQRYNNGLPANLSGAAAPRNQINHGLKALQISVSAWTAEALKLTMPASVFSRSTECHNQDKVSMGTIAARDCIRILELTEQIAAALLITIRQGIALRHGTQIPVMSGSEMKAMYQNLQEEIAFINEDRRLDIDLRSIMHSIRSKKWRLYAESN